MNKVTKKCIKCHRAFQLGYNGVNNNNKLTCDKCAGIQRDAYGHAWHPGETEHVFGTYTVTREQAFEGGNS